MNDEQNTYDETPYASYPYPQSHPNGMATVATLFGMKPQSTHDCRVLELGCASGGNIIPLAVALPGSHFVGIDLSGRQIEEGKETVSQLGLKNVELSCRSILDVTPELGRFDYIICHGVWSWVPAEVREAMLAICRDQLTPHGVAYVSYNTYPGWHMRGTIRDMMVYHTRNLATPQERAGHARALLDFLVRSVPEEANAYSMFLKDEMKLLRGKGDSYLLHEHLEHVNEPVYFYQFEEQAVAKSLQYLGEADIGAMLTEGFGAEVEGILRHVAKNVIEREQYLDFLRNRTFRQTLLCHGALTLNRRPDYERTRRLYFASPVLVPAGDKKTASKEEMKFTAPHGAVTTSDPALKTALGLMAEKWPEATLLETLVAMVQSRIYAEPAVDAARRLRDAESLSSGLLKCYVNRFVEIYVEPPLCKATPSERPVASPLARLQAGSKNVVTNLNHQVIELNDIGRHLLRFCDGTRDRDGLLKGLVELAQQEAIVVHDAEGPVVDSSRIRSILAESLDRALGLLARNAVLIG